MSRFPGLQFPVNNSGQPQTRGQQRPGVNLLQRLFEMKGAKLAKQGQDFQEDSFNAAKEAYEGSLQTYETNKAAHDASEQAKYDAAQSRYDTQLGTYNTAKNAYDTQVTANKQQSEAQAYLQPYFDYRTAQGVTKRPDGTYVVQNPNIAGGAAHTISPGDQRYNALSGTPVSQLAPITTPLPETFNVAPPKFDYTTTAFGSPVPSFEYNAPPSPGAANANKLATMTGLSKQLQEVLPENARNRNRAPQSFYSMF
jgi:hypothetical protein